MTHLEAITDIVSPAELRFSFGDGQEIPSLNLRKSTCECVWSYRMFNARISDSLSYPPSSSSSERQSRLNLWFWSDYYQHHQRVFFYSFTNFYAFRTIQTGSRGTMMMLGYQNTVQARENQASALII